MTRRGNVARLPLPPTLKGHITQHGEDIKAITDHLGVMTTILNQALQSLQNRVNTVQQVKALTPPTVTGLVVTGKQGCFYLTWNRIAHVDGYVVVQASDTLMSQVIGRWNIPDSESCKFTLPVGNVALTSSFQVYAYQGPKMSEPSPIVTATTLVYSSSEGAPPTPPVAPRHPKLVPPRSGPNL